MIATSTSVRLDQANSKNLPGNSPSTPSLRVLHLAAGNLYGGIESFLATLARNCNVTSELECQFGVCFPGQLRDELYSCGCQVHDLAPVKIRRPWTIWLARRRLKRLLLETRPDVVITHSSWLHSIFGSVIRNCDSRLIYFVHGALTGKHWLERWSSRIPPDQLIANSEYSATLAKKLFPTLPCDVLYLPVEQPPPDVDLRERIRAEFGTDPKTVVILSAGRIESGKGQDILLDALEQLPTSLKWECWLAGGPQRTSENAFFEAISRRCASSRLTGRVRLLGHRSDVRRLMAAADLYCQPNRLPESFGITFVEALYAGLPVITSAIGGACEIITDQCGVLTPTNSSSELCRSLRELISSQNLRSALASRGPARAIELCEPARQLKSLAKIISSLRSTSVT